MKKFLICLLILIAAGCAVYFWRDYLGINIDSSKLSFNQSNKWPCPNGLTETRNYYENWSLKEKWCADQNWVFDGFITLYDEQWSLKAEWNMNNGITYSERKFYYSNGSLEKQWEYNWEKEDWAWTFYHSNWNIMSQWNMDKWIKHWNWTFYYSDGNLEKQWNYIDGLENGEWVFYHENSKVAATGEFKNGVKQWLRNTYYENEKKESEWNYIEWRRFDIFWFKP